MKEELEDITIQDIQNWKSKMLHSSKQVFEEGVDYSTFEVLQDKQDKNWKMDCRLPIAGILNIRLRNFKHPS